MTKDKYSGTVRMCLFALALAVFALLLDAFLFKHGVGIPIGNQLISLATIPELAIIILLIHDGMKHSNELADLTLVSGMVFLGVLVLELSRPQIGAYFISYISWMVP